MSTEYEHVLAKYSALLKQIRQRLTTQQLDHAMYQTLIQELDHAERDGFAALDTQFQAALARKNYTLIARIQDSIHEWQRETEDLSKLLRRKSPSR